MPSGPRFDPRAHVRRLDSGADYLDVKWRIAWLRSEHPDAQIETELLAVDEERALCKATVRLPSGGAATAHATASRVGGAGQVELAETRALGRALAALGFGAEYAEEDIVPARPAERPVSLVPPTPVRPLRDVEPPPEPEPEPSPRTERPERAERRAPERPAEPREEPRPLPRADTAHPRAEQPARRDREEDASIAEAPAQPGAGVDVSWTKFWEWAKERGYRDRAHLKELLGVDVMSMSPREVRRLIVKYEMDNPPSGREE